MSRGYELSLQADLESLQEIRQFIDHAGASLGVNSEALGDLRLVVDEAVTNVVLHGYDGRPGTVDIHVDHDGDAVIITIRDQGLAFDASKAEEPHLDAALSERAFGGMGLYLIRKMTDEAVFRSLPGQGNELRMIKRGAISAEK